MKKVEILPDGLAVRFSVAPDQFQPIKNAVKSLTGSWWTQEKKYWKVQNTPSNIARLKELGFELPAEIQPVKVNIQPTPQVAVDFAKLPDILRPYQKEALQFLEARNGKGVLSLAPRCIDGEAVVSINRNKLTRKYTLHDLYCRYNNIGDSRYSWDLTSPTYIRGLKDSGQYGLLTVEAVTYSGKKQSYLLITEDGKSIRSSEDHLFLVQLSDGTEKWTPLNSIEVGDTIVINGTSVCSQCGSAEYRIIYYKYSKYRGWCVHCMAKKRQLDRGVAHKRLSNYDGYTYVCDPAYYNHPRYGKNGIAEHILVAEKMTGKPIPEGYEVHHINKNRSDNRPENLMVLSRSDHKKIHKAETRFKNFTHKSGVEVVMVPKYVKVKSITKDAIIDMYDVAVKEDAHNFVANGILVHNCGKSVVSLCYAMLHPSKDPIVICCPASIKINWSREIEKWTNFTYHIINGTSPYRYPKRDVYIINYDILHDHMSSLLNISVLIIDEAHRINNTTLSKKGADGKTVKVPVQCTEAFYHIAKQAEHIIFLSGTPITSSAKQLFVPLNVFLPEQFNNQYKFQWRYCNPTRNRWGWDFSGLSNGEELFGFLNQIMFRRRREDVFKDLPKESHEFIELEIDQREYEAELEEFKGWLSKHPGTTEEQIQEKLSKFESLSYSKKRTQIKEWISDFLSSGEKVVVFTWHRTVSEDLHNAFKKQSVLMYGSTSIAERQEAIDKFNTDPSCQMFIGNIQAAKEGITLAAANIAVYVEIPFVPGDLEQSGQRIWLPEKKDPLSYLYFVAKDTVDTKRIKSLLTRGKIIGTILDGKETELFGGSLLEELKTDKELQLES